MYSGTRLLTINTIFGFQAAWTLNLGLNPKVIVKVKDFSNKYLPELKVEVLEFVKWLLGEELHWYCRKLERTYTFYFEFVGKDMVFWFTLKWKRMCGKDYCVVMSKCTELLAKEDRIDFYVNCGVYDLIL